MIGYIVVGTGVLDGPLQTVRIAENFVNWTVEDAGPYNFCAVYLEHAVPFAITVCTGDVFSLPKKLPILTPYHVCALGVDLVAGSQNDLFIIKA